MKIMRPQTSSPSIQNRPLFRWTDLVFVCMIVVVAGLIYIHLLHRPKSGIVADIYYRNRLIDQIDLDHARPGRFRYPQDPAVEFEIFPNHSVAFVASDCPDQVCVHAGPLSFGGDSAACLPNQFVLKLRTAQGEIQSGSNLNGPITGQSTVKKVDVIQ